MHKANAHLPKSELSGSPRATLLLDHAERKVRRRVLTLPSGEDMLVDLPQATTLADGDGLALEDGGFVAIAAKPERLLRVTARSALHLLELAWHLGNRHLPTQLADDHLLIAEDAVMARMLKGLGAQLAPVNAPFSPVHGAYHAQYGHTHGHNHHHDHR